MAEDTPGLRLQLAYASADNFTGAQVVGYEAARAWMHPAAAEALDTVRVTAMSQGYGLLIFDAYRPRRATRAFVEFAHQSGHPEWIRDGYIGKRSAHNRGTAVDLALYDLASGTPLDFGGPFDEFGPGAHTENAEGSALEHRRSLRALMSDAGFVPYTKEWWHFVWPTDAAPEFDVVIEP